MRKSLILFVIIFAYIWGCASGDDYDMITKSDRKALKSICKCIEPLSGYMGKMMNTKDSATALQYLDSIQQKGMLMEDCLEKAKEFENKDMENKKYVNQLFAYMQEYHPKCLPFFLGKSDTLNYKEK